MGIGMTRAVFLLALGLGCGTATSPAEDADVPDPDDGAMPDVVAEDGGSIDGEDDAGPGDAGDAGDAEEADGGDADSGRPVGSLCNLPEQCADGVVPAECLSMIWAIEAPDGYCTAFGCRFDEDCPGGASVAACAEMYPRFRACMARCDGAADCREGYQCLDPDDTGTIPRICVPFCTATSGCPGGMTCDAGGRPPLCHRTGTDARVNGEPCAHHADCHAGSYCLAERALFSGWPSGYCTQDCRTQEDCGNGGVCVLSCEDDDDNILNDPCDDDTRPGVDDPSNNGLCLDDCTPTGSNACLRPGYACRAVGPHRTREHDVCVPNCSAAACENVGWTCDPNAGVFIGGGTFGYGRCQPPLDVAALGGPCRVSGGCRGGFCLAESLTGYPHGLCTEECGVGDACPSSEFGCSSGGLFPGLCFRRCESGATECRPGLSCQDLGWGITTCAPACTTNAHCANGCCHQDTTGYCDPTREFCGAT
jgi:hypothetical protein